MRFGCGGEKEGAALVVESHGIVKIAQGGWVALGALSAPVHEEADAEAAKEAEDVDGIAMAHAALVFLGRDIEALMQPVFDPPAGAVELEPALGAEPLGGGAGEQVHGFGLACAGVALQHGGLRGGGKSGLLGGDRRRLEGARFGAPFISFPRLRPAQRGGGRADEFLRGRGRDLRRGEKRPARAAVPEAVFAKRADCL